MKLHRITISNFRSFKGEATFHFPEEPGIYFMQGLNELEPRLGANGAGKSTIWDALLWLLFEKTSRGLKAGDVCNWDVEKGTCVELAYQTDDNLSLKVMKRTWKPNTWTTQDLFGKIIDLTKDEQSLADFNLEFKPFLHCILMAQSQPMFLDLDHTRQAELFSEVMGLDHWIDYSGRASKKASDQDMETRKLERRLSELQGQINGQQDFQGSVEQFETDREFELSGYVKPYNDKLDQLRVLKIASEEAETLEKRRREEYKDARDACDQFQIEKLKPAQKLFDTIKDGYTRMDIQLDHSVKAYGKIKLQKDCPTCKRPLDRASHKEHLGEALMKMEVDQQAFDLLDKEFVQAEASMKRLGEQGALLIIALEKADQQLTDAEQSVKTQRQAILRVEKELDDIEDTVERLEKKVNPFLEVQRKAKEEGARLRADRDATQDQLDSSVEKYQLYSYWVRGFKELRLQLIAEALTELEIEVNSCVTELGLVDWELRFEVDREGKGGNIKRGFSVQVLSPTNTRPTPWEAWSGGESQRLRLAATMGLSNLIRSRMGVELNLEVWDEPSTALSPQGIQDLLEALEHRANTEQRVIWVVDHTAHAFGGFKGGAMITKSRKGSSIQQY